MNEMTKKLFELIKENSEESFQKMQAILTASLQLTQNNLKDLAIDWTALVKESNEAFSLVAYAIYHNNVKACDWLCEQGVDLNLGNPTPLICAINQKSIALVSKLLEQSVDINLGNPTPLWVATEKVDKEIVTLLIDQGALIDKESSIEVRETVTIITRDAWKSNKYHYDEETRQLLLEVTEKLTPLSQAVKQGSVEIAELLLINDANPNLKITYQYNLSFKLKEKDKFKDKTYEDLINNLDPKIASLFKSLFKTIKYITFAKEAYHAGKKVELIKGIGDAYTENTNFFLNYLGNKIRHINAGFYTDLISHHYLLNFIKIFCFIVKEAGNQIDIEKISLFQKSSLVLELLGHDPEKKDQKWPLFSNLAEKNKFIQSISQGAAWEASLLTMSSSINTLTPYSSDLMRLIVAEIVILKGLWLAMLNNNPVPTSNVDQETVVHKLTDTIIDKAACSYTTRQKEYADKFVSHYLATKDRFWRFPNQKSDQLTVEEPESKQIKKVILV